MGLFSKPTESVEILKERRAALETKILEAQRAFGPARERLAAALVAGEKTKDIEAEFGTLSQLLAVGPGALDDLTTAIARRELADVVDTRTALLATAKRARARFEAAARKLAESAEMQLTAMTEAVREVLPYGPRGVGTIIYALASENWADAREDQEAHLKFVGIIRALEKKGEEIEKYATRQLEEAQEALDAFDAAR